MLDLLVFIGRFQPYHYGHKTIIDEALNKAKKVLIVIGSANEPATHRNPFSASFREDIIRSVHQDAYNNGRLLFHHQVDHTYNLDRWIADVKQAAEQVGGPEIGLIGHVKDSSSFYLKCFPNWKEVPCPNHRGINATDLREKMFEGRVWDHLAPPEVYQYIEKVRQNFPDVWYQLVNEHKFIKDYKQQWANSPYSPTFVTADACVIQAGHVLLIERKEAPGKGLLALPGGFINPDESIKDAAVRELWEETRIDIPKKVLHRIVDRCEVFDDPNRSSRGRTITHCFRFPLALEKTFTKVKGSDDAKKAFWVSLSNIPRNAMFEDHYNIIQTMVN